MESAGQEAGPVWTETGRKHTGGRGPFAAQEVSSRSRLQQQAFGPATFALRHRTMSIVDLSAQVARTGADGGLAKTLEVARVHPEVTALLAQEGVENLLDLHGFFTRSGYEVECAALVDRVDATKGLKVHHSRLRVAYQVAAVLVEQPAEAASSQTWYFQMTSDQG